MKYAEIPVLCSAETARFSLIYPSRMPVFRSVPETERHAFLWGKKACKKPFGC